MVDNWLDDELAHALLRNFLETEKSNGFRDSRLIDGQNCPNIRSDQIIWLSDNHTALQILNPNIQRLRDLLNSEFFLGLNSQEFHFAKYAAGGHYEKHLDASPVHSAERVISMVYYLNRQPEGGELMLHLPSGEQKIAPIWNRLVLFRSDFVWHEVLPSKNDRRSLTGWFLRTRP